MKFKNVLPVFTHCLTLFMAMLLFLHQNADCSDNSPTAVTISGVGDIMMGTHYPTVETLPPNDGRHLFSGVSKYLENSDVVMGNLEGSLLDIGETYKKCDDPKNCFAFKMPERYVSHLINAGFNLLSIANNHIGDFGMPGRERTMRILRQAGIRFAGTDTQSFDMFVVNNVKYGFCAFSPNLRTPDIRNIEMARSIVSLLDRHCDIVIVSFHGGAEGGDNRHVTRNTEMYNLENRGNVYEFSHSVIDAGADVVFGHGPHVTRAVELYKNRFIAYSLGNFCTYGRFNLLSHNGVAPIIRLKIRKSGEFESGKIIPVTQSHKKPPVFDSQSQAIKDIIELTTDDFPDSKLTITPDGDIMIKP